MNQKGKRIKIFNEACSVAVKSALTLVYYGVAEDDFERTSETSIGFMRESTRQIQGSFFESGIIIQWHYWQFDCIKKDVDSELNANNSLIALNHYYNNEFNEAWGDLATIYCLGSIQLNEISQYYVSIKSIYDILFNAIMLISNLKYSISEIALENDSSDIKIYKEVRKFLISGILLLCYCSPGHKYSEETEDCSNNAIICVGDNDFVKAVRYLNEMNNSMSKDY